MKKIGILWLALLMLIPFTGISQKVEYDSNHKYKNILSNCSIRVYALGAQQLSSNLRNFGFGLGFDKPLSDHWAISGQGEVHGILANGFDRDARLFIGPSLDFRPFYIFGRFGGVYNPSDRYNTINLGINGGLGLKFKYVFVEAAIDRVSHGNYWSSDVTAYVGCQIPLGIMPSDERDQLHDQEVRTGYGNLIQENKQLKSQVAKQEKMNQQFELYTTKTDSLMRVLDARLKACEAENKTLTEAANNPSSNGLFKPVYFEFASSDITPNQMRNVVDIAKVINSMPNAKFTITGYCSNNGGDYSNQRLSESRACEVYVALVRLGVNPDQLISSGMGKTIEFSEYDDHLNQCVIVRKSR